MEKTNNTRSSPRPVAIGGVVAVTVLVMGWATIWLTAGGGRFLFVDDGERMLLQSDYTVDTEELVRLGGGDSELVVAGKSVGMPACKMLSHREVRLLSANTVPFQSYAIVEYRASGKFGTIEGECPDGTIVTMEPTFYFYQRDQYQDALSVARRSDAVRQRLPEIERD